MGILPPFWKVTNQLLVHHLVGQGSALSDQLLMQLSDVVTACLPALGNLFEIGIKAGFSRARESIPSRVPWNDECA
ncbi:MAG: hypothetical protein ACJ8AG_01695 [Ktedonobacteraceae bacterium]